MENLPGRTGSAEPVRITVIAPVVLDGLGLDPLPVVDGVVAHRVGLRYGTAAIESRFDDAFAVPGILDAAIRAEQDGSDAVVIDCMDDPGLDAAREVVRIPVIGTAEASMHLALCLADRFTILTTAAEDIPIVRELVQHHRLEHRCASIRAIGIGVLDLHADPDDTLQRLAAAGRAAVDEDGAAALIPGCTLLSGTAERLAAHLAITGPAVPVIDPLAAALHHAQTLVRLGVSHSGVGYPPPVAKEILWPGPDSLFGPTHPAADGGIR